ncbi:MAG: DUF3822 family protein [Flavobacteriales bacterium]|nr:DUF3822 family protein [Flavobacteriales bacterium]
MARSTDTDAHHLPRYDREATGLHLGIVVHPDGLAWSVHDRADGRCLVLAQGRGATWPAEEHLPRHPASVSFCAMPELSTLVPESTLRPGTEAGHLSLVHGPLPTGLLRDEPVEDLGARCVYLHDEGMEHQVLERFPAARAIALRSLLVRAVLTLGRQGPALVAHRVGKRMDVALADAGGLKLSNAYHCATGTDALFYLLHLMDALHLAPADAAVHWCGPGWAAPDTDLLRRYLPTAAPALSGTDAMLVGLDAPSPEAWWALLEQAACAS